MLYTEPISAAPREYSHLLLAQNTYTISLQFNYGNEKNEFQSLSMIKKLSWTGIYRALSFYKAQILYNVSVCNKIHTAVRKDVYFVEVRFKSSDLAFTCSNRAKTAPMR